MAYKEPLDEQPAPTPASITVNILRENHEAELILERTSADTIDPGVGELMGALAGAGVAYGIKSDVVTSLATLPVYNEKIVAATGTRPEVGEDGRLIYKVETERRLRPAEREDGTVDFKDLGFVSSVEKGQELIEIVPPTQGSDGTDVMGETLPGIFGKEQTAPKGEGTELSEDGRYLVAAVAGNAVLSKGVLSVQEVLKILGSIDNSTGDINFTGDIMIGADVAAGFKVQSGGSITVKGIVDAAQLSAGGDIIIGEGVNGMDRAILRAGENIRARYLQNCTVSAGGDVFADTIMHTNLECNGNLELGGKRGQLIGGSTMVAGKLTAKGIGTPNHAATQVTLSSLGMGNQREREQLLEQIAQIDADITKLVQVLNRFEALQSKGVKLDASQQATVAQVKAGYNTLSGQRKQAAQDLAQLDTARLSSAQSSYAECKGKIYTGVRFTFGPLNYVVQSEFVNSRVGIVDGEIKLSTL